MQQREHLLEDRYDMGTSGTVTFNLDYSSPITSIDLLFEATNGATSCKNNPIERNISKIEIVDGGQVLWDLQGDVSLAFIATLRGALPHSYRTGAISDTPYQTIPIVFGRELYDEQLAFNPKAHRNPQIKVTFDEATVTAAGATGYVSDSFNISLLVHLMENGAQPQGFLSCRQVETFTSLASGDKRIEMPTDQKIRNFILRCYESGVDMRSGITNVKFSMDGGKRVPFDFYVRNLLDSMIAHFRPILVPFYTPTNDGETHQTWVGIDLEAFVRSHVSGHIATASSSWPGQMTIAHKLHDNTSVDGQPVHFGVIGWGFHNTYVYPFGRLWNPDDWLDLADVRKLDCFLTQGNAGAECDVAVQSLYRY